MEDTEQALKTPRMSMYSGRKGDDLTNVTIFGTPRPQASSTVERRTFGSQFTGNNFPRESNRCLYNSPPENLETSTKTSDSSLGILDNLPSFLSDDSALSNRENSNINNIMDERELARKLLQRCSEIHLSNFIQDTNKENDANLQNLSEDKTPSTLIDSAQSFNLSPAVSKDHSTLRSHADKTSTASVNFEPEEITARSSAMSKSSENKDAVSTTESTDGISFGPGTAGLIAQFENEDFQSGSKMSSQLLADEISWQQNASFALPVTTSTEKEHLELSCFSGIIGDLDLTVESCAGRKVSVGEFFSRKCGQIGQLSEVEHTNERPSFGINVKSPRRIGKNIPLVDVTTMTEDSTNNELLRSFDESTREHTLISLSTIARTLQDIDNGTPRRLVDQLIKAQKEKKKLPHTEAPNLTSNTYTLLGPTGRISLPVCSSNNSKNFDKEAISLGRSSKLSLDSRNVNNTLALLNPKISRVSTDSREARDATNYQVNDTLVDILEEKLPMLDSPSVNSRSPNPEKIDIKNYATVKQATDQSLKNLIKTDAISRSRESQTDFKKHKNKESPRNIHHAAIKKEEISAHRSALEASVSTNISSDQTCLIETIEIGKNTQELEHCIVGVRREVDIDMMNKSHRWIICSLTLSQIQGDKDNVELEVTPKMMLLPDACKTIKICVTVLKPGKPILVALNAVLSEMPRSSAWHMQHTMWFVPEEPNIILSAQTTKDELGFQSGENSNKTQTIVLENKNSVEVPLKLSIVDSVRRRFTLECHEDQPNRLGSHDDVSMCIVLNSSDQFKATIRYNGTHESDRKKKESVDSVAKLLLSIQQRERDLPIRELTLVSHPAVIKSPSVPTDRTSDYLRCDTPQCRGTISSPTSPHSSVSNRSGISGRNSPLSSASGGTVAGDVISIRATHAALVWNSIKVGKQDTKEFTIRNTSNNKIKLQATIVDSDKSFKFLRERQHVATHIVLNLQRMESRTFSVVFGPNNAGAAAGRIVFKHYEPKRESNESRPSKVIFLYGYGGIGKVEITEAFKDTGGQLWLSLGSLNAGGTLDAKIKLQNTGDLCSYAKVKLTPKAVYPAMVSSWHVDPTELLLGPKEVRWVTLEFHPRKEDLALLKRANVSHVGTLTITHGDEPTRLRIRRLYKKLSQSGQMSGKENEAFRNVVYPICKVFPGEVTINNLNIIRDSVENLGDLCRGVRQHEVMLTMEVNAEESMSILHDNADDSQMFYSLCSDNSHVFPATEESFMPSETLMECTTDQRIYEDDFTVSPSGITLTPPTANEATIMIVNSSNVAQPFETVLSHSEFLGVVPAEGMIPTKRGFPLRIYCKKRIEHNLNAILQVYTANDKRDVQIRVVLS